jgi:predicted nuclease with TOPRIM domain
MKTKHIIIGGLILIAVFVMLTYRSCVTIDKYSHLKGQYDALSEEYGAQKEAALGNITELQNQIAQKDEKIHDLNSSVSTKNEQIKKLNAENKKLEDTYATLTDDKQRIANLETQVSVWKEKFTLAEGVIAEKDKIIFALTEKYETQVKITGEYKELYEREARLRGLLEEHVRIADSKLGGLQLKFNVSKGVTIALAGLIIYGLVSK